MPIQKNVYTGRKSTVKINFFFFVLFFSTVFHEINTGGKLLFFSTVEVINIVNYYM
jgi:hypothetical protein